MEVQPQGVDAALGAHGLPAGAEVVVRVEQGHGVQHRLDQGLERGSAKLGDDVGVADVEADPDSLRADPVDATTEDIGLADSGSGPGKTGARFSTAIVTPSRSASSDRAASERASNSSASSLSGASGRAQAW
jgi:hypothetical protein